MIARRIREAAEEIRRCEDYDYVLINRELAEAEATLSAIVRAERARRTRIEYQIRPILDTFQVHYPDPMHQQIGLRAYESWQQRGCPLGTPETDWFRAEQELTKPESVLSRVAREVGTAIGTVVALQNRF